jgi:hypothetical protein
MIWRFNLKRPSDKTRDPVVSEFFASDAIKGAGEALVREGIQNALDARAPENADGAVRVRIYRSEEEAALTPAQSAQWFSTAWPHYLAPGNGLRPGDVLPDLSCRFLVFEDFGTTGLIGDQNQYEEREGAKNPFFYFFRAEAKTAKEGDDRGRWGVGKQVFPRSSRAQTFFGFSETSTGRFLMGGCVLKHHTVNGVMYTPDGFCGDTIELMGDTLTVPTTDPALLESFHAQFRLARRPGEHGLSVVVPWLDERTENGEQSPFDRGSLALAVLEGYFIPIIEGRLEVSVEDSSGTLRITASTFETVLQQLHGLLPDRRRAELRRLGGLLRVATDAKAGRSISIRLPPCPQQKAVWTDEMLSSETASSVREELRLGHTVRVSTQLTVRPKAPNQPTAAATVDCYVAREPGVVERPCHVREDLIITNVDASRVADHYCIVRVDKGPLAKLLGDAENPAHTEWQASSRNFKDKYTYGGVTIQFVSNFAAEVLRRTYAASRTLDRTILLDLFFDSGPEEEQQAGARRPAAQPADAPTEVPRLPTVVGGFRLGRSETGFTVNSVGTGLPPGTTIAVTAAYETAKGNPFAAYSPLDFEFSDESFEFEEVGCRVSSKKENRLEVVIDAPEFQLRVDGFDVNRDVVVRAVKRVGPTQSEPEEDVEPAAADASDESAGMYVDQTNQVS